MKIVIGAEFSSRQALKQSFLNNAMKAAIFAINTKTELME